MPIMQNKDHCQFNGEESTILEYFKGKHGTLLDIGANDGIKFSNSRSLILLGWDAVLVEPSKSAFTRLQETYKDNDRVTLVNVGIGTESGIMDLYDCGTVISVGSNAVFSGPDQQADTSLLSTFNTSMIERWNISFPGTIFTPVPTQCITYAELQEMNRRQFDFITIDAEGMDLDILRQIDLSNTQMVMVEIDRASSGPYEKHCNKYGLTLLYKNWANAIFAR
jgi:FkbM family methyltransferase